MIAVAVIDRAAQADAWGHGNAGASAFVRTVEIHSTCATCGGPRGVPTRRWFVEDGDGYAVDCWKNPCGHLDTYADVLREADAIRAMRSVTASAQ